LIAGCLTIGVDAPTPHKEHVVARTGCVSLEMRRSKSENGRVAQRFLTLHWLDRGDAWLARL